MLRQLWRTAATCRTACSSSVLTALEVIAHIDHGKTTLVDRILTQAQRAYGGLLTLPQDGSQGSAGSAGAPASAEGPQSMDSNTLERERGITILSKYTSFRYKDHVINIVDTPGHADFGGEVERVLGLVDGAVLLVDATEGPLAQTKYVLGKALARGLKPIVVLNKVDRPSATAERCGLTESSLLDLFISLGASDDQLDFPLLYASAREGWVSSALPPPGNTPPATGFGMAPLLDLILNHVPAPPEAALHGPFAMSVAMIERDNYVGRIATGRVASGSARAGDRVQILKPPAPGQQGGDGSSSDQQQVFKIVRVTKRVGHGQVVQVDQAVAGDVVSLCGIPASITDTIAAPEVTTALDPGHVEPPTLSMLFGPNDSPLAGSAGTAATARVIGERLMAEAETSVSLKVAPLPGGTERYEVQARGELQLSVLIEGMRREGLELAVSPPQVLTRRGEGGGLEEPVEEVTVEVQEEVAGQVIDALSLRRGELSDMVPAPGGRQRLTFVAPSRGLIGFKSVFVNLTRGEGLMTRAFLRYEPHKGPLGGVRKGCIISISQGEVSRYALTELQPRGVFFVQPGDQVYNGQIVGEHAREDDLEVNCVKVKHTSNVRQAHAEKKIPLAPARLLSLEEAIGYVQGDELIEVTPAAVRLRKQELDTTRRQQAARQAARLRREAGL